jgi:hypothetical protein
LLSSFLMDAMIINTEYDRLFLYEQQMMNVVFQCWSSEKKSSKIYYDPQPKLKSIPCIYVVHF